jgi:membrane-associated phospholipid phosphatase
MTRRAYGFAVGLAVVVGLLAWVASYRYDLPLRDPDSLAGPLYVRLPLIVLGFYAADVVPRALIENRGFANFGASVKSYTRTRWTRSRIALVSVGLGSFYVIYVAYRNLKGYLPFVRDRTYDSVLMKLDRALAFDHYPGDVLHTVLGTGISAHVLSLVYVLFIVFVPLSLGAALVWSKNVATGFWYVIALCANWVLGAASYYWMPSEGPFQAKPSVFIDLPTTSVSKIQADLVLSRQTWIHDPFASDSLQGVAAFASLHVSIIFTAALICHFVIPNVWVRRVMWLYFALTVISTVYFGWHYLLDDVAGAAIGLIAVWLGAKLTGYPMRAQRRSSGTGDGLIGVFPPAVDESPSGAGEPPSGASESSPERDTAPA